MGVKIEVGVLGATGTVGQQFITQLADHPWFTVAWVGASERSAGKAYRDATTWRLPAARPDRVAEMTVETVTPGRAPQLLFSGLDASVAGEVETAFARAGHIVVSNARNHRMDPVVPLVIPEINADHLQLLSAQAAKGWSGRIVTNPNCSTVVLAMAVAPLRQFGLRQIIVSTLQAVSGGGYPGVASLDILGNVVPVVPGEEAKIETETKKILGQVTAAGVKAHPVTVSASTTRVPVINGHTEVVTVSLDADPGPDAVIEALRGFSGRPQETDLPSAPPRPVLYLDEEDRPQPRLDADRDNGMTVCVGRLRACPVLDYKFVAMGHNTVRGAAGVAVLNAELLRVDGVVG
ncbi:MAG: aspartate-semialdehyde dehydrogenase [Vicinamibacterales bacterium]|jgi:aspartate-semialdehyde dehydrogenase|nr:aspartate-semialdehyde dehydrogenase [Vicinamibacterales bacterium]HJN45236.1 aspartate-semialdehyde dehydrogenase [Vicinamibacterales bacterium]